jgi:hypothetical protein
MWTFSLTASPRISAARSRSWPTRHCGQPTTPHADELTSDGMVCLRIPATGARTSAACRTLGQLFYPHDPASARHAATLLEQHLVEHLALEHQAALSPVEAYLDKAARPWHVSVRPALTPRHWPWRPRASSTC